MAENGRCLTEVFACYVVVPRISPRQVGLAAAASKDHLQTRCRPFSRAPSLPSLLQPTLVGGGASSRHAAGLTWSMALRQWGAAGRLAAQLPLWAMPCAARKVARGSRSQAAMTPPAARPLFSVTASSAQARAGVLCTEDGKELLTPALVLSTNHGFLNHGDASALLEWSQQHGQLAVAVSGVHMCAPP